MSPTRRPRALIVNADDLGRTAGINAGIFEAHQKGLVTSATLMVGYPSAAGAARALAEHPRLGVGLHVALTGGRPILPPSRVPSLVDAQGELPAKPEGLTDPAPGEVLAEVEAQLARFRELTGRDPTHLDSHHHSHRHKVVGDALIAVAQREGLAVRNASPELARRLRWRGVPTTEFFEESFFGAATGVEDLLGVLDGLPAGVTELMCHPAQVDPELEAGSSYAAPRERELASLMHPDVLSRVEELGIRLLHFGEL